MTWLFQTDPALPLLIVRLGLGIVFFAHGAQKVFGWFGGYGLKGTLGYFKSLGIPTALGVIACFAELLGGIAMIVGFLTKLAAIGLIIDMLVAIAKVHSPNGFFLNWGLVQGKGHGYEMNLALIAMALAILIGGAGVWSIDSALSR